jgi:hypothetical protein
MLVATTGIENILSYQAQGGLRVVSWLLEFQSWDDLIGQIWQVIA